MADYLSQQIPTISPNDLEVTTDIVDVVGFKQSNGQEKKIVIDGDIQTQVDAKYNTSKITISTDAPGIDDIPADKDLWFVVE